MKLESEHRRGMPSLRLYLGVMLLAAAGALAACTGPQPVAPPALDVALPPPTEPPAELDKGPSFLQVGLASWYGGRFRHRRTASGERYDLRDLTAAHRTLPLETIVRVTNLVNNRSVLVRINDRGPFARGRIIDLSEGAAELLGMRRAGVVPVRIEVFANDQFKTVAQYLDDAH